MRETPLSANSYRDALDEAQTIIEQAFEDAPPTPLRYESDLSAEEREFLRRYHSLATQYRLAINCCVTTGDDRLVRAIYYQRVLGLPPGQLLDEARDE